MRTLWGPVVYDFKKALLMKTTLILLVVFIAAGVGVSALVYNTFASQYSSVHSVVVVSLCRGEARITGFALSLLGDRAGHAVLRVQGPGGKVLFEGKTSNGLFNLTSRELYRKIASIVSSTKGFAASYHVEVETSTGKSVLLPRAFRLLECGGGAGGWAIVFASPGFATLIPETRGPSIPLAIGGGVGRAPTALEIAAGYSVVLLDKRSGDSIIIVYGFNTSSPVPRGIEGVVEYNTTRLPGLPMVMGQVAPERLGNLSYRFLGRIAGFYAVYRVKLDPYDTILALRLKTRKLVLVGGTGYSSLIPVRAGFAGVVADTGVRMFAEFFPIVFLYLAYVFMARPKANGVLEFILARPITRLDLYLTRYLAGVLLALVAPGLFLVALWAGSLAAYRILLPAGTLLVLYAGLAGAMIAFYTLCYSIASATRSGYLAIAIILYLVFAFFWGLIAIFLALALGGGGKAFIETRYLLDYFNPLGLASLATYFAQLELGFTAEVPTASPFAAAASGTLWVIISLLLGYNVFRKTELSPSP